MPEWLLQFWKNGFRQRDRFVILFLEGRDEGPGMCATQRDLLGDLVGPGTRGAYGMGYPMLAKIDVMPAIAPCAQAEVHVVVTNRERKLVQPPQAGKSVTRYRRAGKGVSNRGPRPRRA